MPSITVVRNALLTLMLTGSLCTIAAATQPAVHAIAIENAARNASWAVAEGAPAVIPRDVRGYERRLAVLLDRGAREGARVCTTAAVECSGFDRDGGELMGHGSVAHVQFDAYRPAGLKRADDAEGERDATLLGGLVTMSDGTTLSVSAGARRRPDGGWMLMQCNVLPSL